MRGRVQRERQTRTESDSVWLLTKTDGVCVADSAAIAAPTEALNGGWECVQRWRKLRTSVTASSNWRGSIMRKHLRHSAPVSASMPVSDTAASSTVSSSATPASRTLASE